ncbi:MAG: RNA 2'-phosphotransferase [Wendovervirus sonii]|uniref:RNA 2'-phosphotransferase n=1 Tax=phage Lak_Megaphage_Sonny TaxID=3109229 RepID=A0ABZ0Z5T9_9CAUD|nr:MAG: RNA 2'-phosphotransferase [phage Lak_Megaphage_Sonny]
MEQYTKKQLEEKSKELAFLLRHDTNYQFDKHGWRTINDLIDNHGYTFDMLDKIVSTDKKGRYEYNDDKTMIRACQGHSISVNPDLKEAIPPDTLFHGTATRFIEAINNEGIKKMSRNYVQLSENIETAQDVGKRHGSSVVLMIDTKKMHEDGIKFYLSSNNVWMTEYIDPKYIIFFIKNVD